MIKFFLMTSILLYSFVYASEDLPDYLHDIPKTQLCTKSAPIELSIAASIRFIANGNPKKVEELAYSHARKSMLNRHEELCESDSIKNSFDYMTGLNATCKNTCKGKMDCLRICFTVRDVQLVYLDGMRSGKESCLSSGIKPTPSTSTAK